MIKKFIGIMAAFAMLVTVCGSAFAEESAQPEEKQLVFSNEMQKNIIKSYAHNLAKNYYYGVSDENLLFSVISDSIDRGSFDINGALEAMIKTLDDSHAEFYTPEEYKAMTETVSGEFSGIGVTITENDNGIIVLEVIENSAALHAGIMQGDYIVGVDGESTEGLDIEGVRQKIVGQIGSNVTVTVKRGEKTLDLICTRAPVVVSQTKTKMLTDDIAYLKLSQFTKSAAQEVEAYVETLKQNKTKKLVLDLRNNPGGDLDAAVEIAQIFISAGKIGELRYKDEKKNTFLYSKNHNAPKLKIAVLVNENSASASEFLSMAFQTRNAGKIIGTTTYGKGSMQVLMSVITGGGMKYTIGEFYTYDGKRVNTIGISPDIAVENEIKKVDEESFAKIDYNKVDDAASDETMTLALEQRLSALGYFEFEPDGVFDENTTASVKNFQIRLGYEPTGIPGFYEYLYLNDFSYDFEISVDHQLDAAVEYLNGQKI